jgi:predicted ATP-binding protein involved in virulence
MVLTALQAENFKCFEHIGWELHPRFNLIAGINGTGKTALLEAARIAIGSLFLEMDKHEDQIWSPGIEPGHIRLAHLEAQYPARITGQASIPDPDGGPADSRRAIAWTRSLDRSGGRTTKLHARPMQQYSLYLQEQVRAGASVVLPLVAYYSTDRFKRERRDTGIVPDGSRLRGYFHALAPGSNFKFFLDLYKTETLAGLQRGESPVWLEAVNRSVTACVPDSLRMYHDVRRDELLIELRSIQDLMPYHALSEGVRSMLGLVMELAFRCCLLNPHLGADAPARTPGVVLIDELDLHLHPSWQKNVTGDLQQAFPMMQFIASTHAPLVIGSLRDGAVFSISDRQVYRFPPQYGRDANAILLEMDTEPMASTLRQDLDRYFLMIEAGEGHAPQAAALRAALERQLGTDHPEIERADLLLQFFAA